MTVLIAMYVPLKPIRPMSGGQIFNLLVIGARTKRLVEKNGKDFIKK